MSDAIAPEYVSDDLPGLTAMGSYQRLEKSFCRYHIALCLKIHINNFTMLDYCLREIVLLAIDSDEDFINIEGIAIALMAPLLPTCVQGTEFDAP